MKVYRKDYYTANRTLTKHVCQNCLHIFYARASFYTCPQCGENVQTPVILEACEAFPTLVIQLMEKALRATANKEYALVLIQRSLPGFSVEAIKIIWEEVNLYAKD